MENHGRPRRGSFGRGALLLARVMLACAFFESAGLCQNTYSDVWLVGSSPSAVMAGCAVTDESYFGYNHEFYITTTITSPGGRTATGYGGNGGCSHSGSPECGQANVSLPVTHNDEWELGHYFIESIHQTYCPYRAMELQDVFTSAVEGVALLKTAFVHVGDDTVNCYYNSTCAGVCNTGPVSYIIARKLFPGPCPQPYIQCRELFAGNRCFKDTRVCTGQFERGVCD